MAAGVALLPSSRSSQAVPCRLTDLWLNDNKIANLDSLKDALAAQRTTLTCIYLENNPLQENRAVYRATLLDILPNLEQLDSNDVVR
mmetsp:Transcript_30914/g.87513  ORF Transcript_30914/g.87513 Transcript_30914/m.87513 type:complete len:87 (-) Transcript_30914:3536-3796(-)